MKLHEISVKKPVAVVMVILMFAVIGLYALTMLPIELTPNMDLSMAIVATQYTNVGSEEVETMITKPIEGAISSISGVDTVTSQSSEGISLVMVQFSSGTDMDKATADMESSINMIESFLPEDAGDPMVLKLDTDMLATAQFSISYEGYDLVQTKQFVDDTLEAKLKSVNGVANVSVTGAQNRQIDVYINPSKLYDYNMTMTDVATSIAAQNQNLPAGTTNALGKKLSARMLGKFESIEDLESVPLMTKTGQVINLKDIATVKDSYSDIDSIARLDDSDAISITISKESDANTVDVVKGIYKVLDDMHATNPKFTYNMTMEQGTMIEEAVNSVADNAITGAFLAVIILLLFLGSMKSSLVIGISMPVSIVTTFIGMYFSGMSLNVVSLGGLALGVGMLVDNAVVVIENISRHRSLGLDPKDAAIKGSGEVVGAVVASVLTTCIVYVPIIFIDNMVAIMFKQLAFSIIFSQIASLLVTFLLIPMFSSKIKPESEKKSRIKKIFVPFERFMEFCYKLYEKSMKFILRHRKSFVAIVLAIFAVCMVVLGSIGMELIPSTDSGTVTVSATLPSGTPLEKTDETALKIEEIIKQNKNVEHVFSLVGSSGDAASTLMGSGAENTVSITVALKDISQRKDSSEDVVYQLRTALKDISGAQVEVSTQSMAMASMASDEMSIQFSANDDEKLEEYVLEAQKVLAGVDGVAETSTSIADTNYELHVRPNRDKAMRYGLTPAQTATMVNGIISGMTASRYSENGSEYDIKLKYPDDYANSMEKLKELRVSTPTGTWVSLEDIADIGIEEGYTTLTRVDQRRVITLYGKLYGTDLATATDEFNKAIKDIDTPDGILRESAGTYEVMVDAISQLGVAILLGILLMYMIMAAQFGNLSQPLIILGTIPLAMIGVVLSLVISSGKLSAVSCVGILMLMGIVVNNAIVLIEFINQSRKDNPDADRDELIIKAGITRMRPILMTSLTSILGFLPMAMTSEGGSALMQPLAIVLMGGLLVGTFLTLYVIPSIYAMFDNVSSKHKLRKEKRLAKKMAVKGE
ncbi:MAG: efflux RND transporter permease subunit [Clostridia bacterium]|nr:efflux RND transporter permease subunit [Clostridia bacterium]